MSRHESMGGIIGDLVDGVTSIPKSVSSALTGRSGITGSRGPIARLLKGDVKGAAASAGRVLSKVTHNHVMQAVFPGVAVPASIVGGAASGGKHGALEAVSFAAQNPVMKTELAALAVVFPPLAPASAAGIAAMEATARLADGLDSGDPKKIAAAAMQVGGTLLKAKAGSPGAARALDLLDKTEDARKLVAGADPGRVARIVADAKRGVPAAKSALAMLQFHQIRTAHKTASSSSAPPAKKAAAHRTLAKAQKTAPATFAATVAALSSPKGVRVGQFALLRTGRILYKGQPVRKARTLPAKRSAHHPR